MAHKRTRAIDYTAGELCRAWARLAPQLRRDGLLDERSALGLVFTCQRWAQYALLLRARSRWPNDRTIAAALEGARERTREAVADFSLIPPSRVRVSGLTATGEDSDLLRIFGRPAA